MVGRKGVWVMTACPGDVEDRGALSIDEEAIRQVVRGCQCDAEETAEPE